MPVNPLVVGQPVHQVQKGLHRGHAHGEVHQHFVPQLLGLQSCKVSERADGELGVRGLQSLNPSNELLRPLIQVLHQVAEVVLHHTLKVEVSKDDC